MEKLKKMFNGRILAILTITLVVLLFGFYRFNQRFAFNWDQSDDANKVAEMISLKKPLLIGPRVANESGFFVGPFHYYFLAPFFVLFNGDPIAEGIAAIVVALITSISGYLLASKMFNKRLGLFTGLIFASMTSIQSWNVMYTSFFGILGYFLCWKIINSKTKYFPLLMFVYGMAATSHLVPASMGLSILVALIISAKKPTFKQIFLGIGLFLISFVPNLIFDLRHDFLNLKKIIAFVSIDNHVGDHPWWLFLRSFWRGVNLSTFAFDINKNQLLIILGNALVLSILIFEIIKIKNNKLKLLTVVWMMTPLLALGFYKGNIPEYYYGLSLSILPILLASFIKRLNWKIGLILVIIFVSIRFYRIWQDRPMINLSDKKNVVKYIAQQKEDPIFNVSYDLPVGMETGYDYLFNFYKHQPVNTNQGHLYTIVLLPSGEDEKVVYKSNRIGVIRR